MFPFYVITNHFIWNPMIRGRYHYILVKFRPFPIRDYGIIILIVPNTCQNKVLKQNNSEGDVPTILKVKKTIIANCYFCIWRMRLYHIIHYFCWCKKRPNQVRNNYINYKMICFNQKKYFYSHSTNSIFRLALNSKHCWITTSLKLFLLLSLPFLLSCWKVLLFKQYQIEKPF